VIAPSFSFVATIAPAVQLGATPVFIDSERDSWNMDPELLAEELARRSRRGALPKLVLAADIYGQGCDIDRIQAVCAEYGVPVIEDAAEAIGATYKGRPVGAGSAVAAFSFNGNKIITTSGGGMLLARDPAVIRHARHLATQARDPAHHYEHSELGYNYRLSNVLAAIGRGQLRSLDDFVRRRRQVFAWYQQRLADLEGISFMPEAATGCCSRWLTVVQFGAAARVSPEQVRAALEVEAIEARPVWKPMHLQPVFKGAAHVGGSVCAEFFANGLCLPSGSALTETDIDRVAEVVRACMRKDPGV
jgi:pyridoxal phosphate-dependent aminotransferase EpsN